MPVDVLAIAAHPDDVELTCGGTLAQAQEARAIASASWTSRAARWARGARRRSARREAKRAAEILGAEFREALDLGDGGLRRGREEELAVIDVIRREKPRIVFTPYPDDRHPDHRRAGQLVTDACYYAGTRKIETKHPAHRPQQTIYFSTFVSHEAAVPGGRHRRHRRAPRRDAGLREPVPQGGLDGAADHARAEVVSRDDRGARPRVRRDDQRRVRRGLPGLAAAPDRRPRRRPSKETSPASSQVDCSSPMKIGITCYPTFGGSGVVATELGIALAARGDEVHFISYALPSRLDLPRERVHFHEVVAPSYPLFVSPPYTLALATKMAEVARHAHLDLLHVHYALPHAVSAILAREMGNGNGVRLKVVTTLHGTDVTIVGQDRSYLPITRWSIDQSDAVTAVSQIPQGRHGPGVRREARDRGRAELRGHAPLPPGRRRRPSRRRSPGRARPCSCTCPISGRSSGSATCSGSSSESSAGCRRACS